ncbi:MAG: TetR/AcrR family transcriptional regulator [Gemmataceae bacterium]|nr:TetR/AcrR family transcriptional regulator [Gemmataceae bacterium]MDW8267244.1 TetR/AcrR family transcriptional regulator [Gemmataceae bacterium]
MRASVSAAERRKATSAQSRRRLRSQEQRPLVLRRAQEVLSQCGYRDTTWARVAEAAGVSETTVSRMFKTKAGLVRAILEELATATVRRWRGEMALMSDPLGKWHAAADFCTTAAREHAETLRLLYRVYHEADDPDVTAAVQGLGQEVEDLLADIIREGQQAGVFRLSLDPRVAAWELVHATIGRAVTATLPVPVVQSETYAAQAHDCALHGLLKTDV